MVEVGSKFCTHTNDKVPGQDTLELEGWMTWTGATIIIYHLVYETIIFQILHGIESSIK